MAKGSLPALRRMCIALFRGDIARGPDRNVDYTGSTVQFTDRLVLAGDADGGGRVTATWDVATMIDRLARDPGNT